MTLKWFPLHGEDDVTFEWCPNDERFDVISNGGSTTGCWTQQSRHLWRHSVLQQKVFTHRRCVETRSMIQLFPCTGGNLASFVLAQDVYTAGHLWCTFPENTCFMVIHKLHWLPIHSLVLMFDQYHCRPILSVLPAHCWPCNRCEKHSVLTPEPVYQYVRQCKLCICKYFSNTDRISNTNTHPLWFSIHIHHISVFKYVFKPNLGL